MSKLRRHFFRKPLHHPIWKANRHKNIIRKTEEITKNVLHTFLPSTEVSCLFFLFPQKWMKQPILNASKKGPKAQFHKSVPCTSVLSHSCLHTITTTTHIQHPQSCSTCSHLSIEKKNCNNQRSLKTEQTDF